MYLYSLLYQWFPRIVPFDGSLYQICFSEQASYRWWFGGGEVDIYEGSPLLEKFYSFSLGKFPRTLNQTKPHINFFAWKRFRMYVPTPNIFGRTKVPKQPNPRHQHQMLQDHSLNTKKPHDFCIYSSRYWNLNWRFPTKKFPPPLEVGCSEQPGVVELKPVISVALKSSGFLLAEVLVDGVKGSKVLAYF